MECGPRHCLPLSFCHEATNTCKACSSICDAARPNQFEPSLCLEHCRDYMYEQLKTSTGSVDGTARVLGGVGLGLGVFALLTVLVLVGVVAFYVYRRPRKLLHFLQSRIDVETPDMKVKMSTNNNKLGADIGRDLNSSVCTVSGSVSEAELRMHAAPQQPPPPPTTLTLPTLAPAPPPPPARHPSEDSTLDYAAYDNPALSPSSSPLPPGSGASKAMDAVLEAVLDHATLPGSVPLHNAHNAILANGSVARMESSF